MCQDLEIPYEIKEHPVIITDDETNHEAAKNIPTDLPYNQKLVAVRVSADGNCLSHSGSYMASGHEDNDVEIRVRIVVEQVKHCHIYLDSDHLRQGNDCTEQEGKILPNNYCIASDALRSTGKLDAKEIDHIYQTEVMNIRQETVYMGIWQIFALASILDVDIFSVYPNKGNPMLERIYTAL